MIIVLLSAYNGAKYIEEQLESIRLQYDVRVKLIIRNDGSTDHGMTKLVLDEYVRRNKNFDIEILEGENIGFVKSFTELLRYAINKYPQVDRFAFSDQDDIWLSNKLSEGLKQFKKLETGTTTTKPLAYACNKKIVDDNLNVIKELSVSTYPQITEQSALLINYATGCTMIFNRTAALLYLKTINDKVKVHDFWMYLICVYFGDFYFDKTPYILYRQHGNNQIGAPSRYEKWKKRIKYGHTKSKGIITSQTQNFSQSFESMLSEEQKKTLAKIINYKSSILNRFRLLIDKRFSYPTKEANWIFKYKIVKGSL